MDTLIDIIEQPNWKILLNDVVKANDFDIWNLDIINLIDIYLKKIQDMKKDNLLIPANALLAAAILLKIKTFTLKLTSIEEEEPLKIPNEEDLLDSLLNIENPARFKEGQVSLDELIDVVNFMMNRPTKANLERKIIEKKEDIFVLPKKTEDIGIRINRLFEDLKVKVDKEGCTTFSKLLNNDFELQNLVDNCFIPLLFLSQEQKVNIWQDDFFSEIFIKIIWFLE